MVEAIRRGRADRQSHSLWGDGVRPGAVSRVGVAPTPDHLRLLTAAVTMGIAASHKIWVYDPQQLMPTRKPARAARKTAR